MRVGLCRYLDFVGKGSSWISGISPVDLPDAGDFWNRVLCDRNKPFPEDPPPFTGGQCPGVQYLCQVLTAGGIWRTAVPLATFGPVSEFREEFPGAGEFTVTARDAQGGPLVTDGPIITDRVVPIEKRVIRADGQPDECGDPPPDIPPFPPEGDTINIDITYTNNEGDTVIELGDLRIFAPVVIAPVNIVAPIRVNLPDVSFDGQIVIAPRFDVILNPPGPSVGPGEEGGDDEQPTQDDEKELVGVRVITPNPTTGNATVIFGQGAAPNLYVPRLATVQYELLFDGATTWTDPIDVKTSDQFIPAPKVGLVTRFVINNIPNVSSVVRPVFVPEQPRCC